MTDQPEPRPLTDADLLAWAVVLGYREEQQRDGLSMLGLSYPPCPTCRGEVHGVTYWSLVDRLSDGGRLAIRPCGHVHSFTEDDIERLHEHASEMVRVIRAADDSRDPNARRWMTDDIIREAQDRVDDEPEDTCRRVDIDDETIRVRGAGELTDEDRTAFAEVVQAAKTKFAAEAPEQVGVLQNRLRLAHKARRAKEHQLDDIRRALCDIGFMQDDDPYSHADLADVIRQNGPAATEAPDMETPARVIELYERWVKEGAPPLGTPIARWWDKRLVELHEAIKAPADQPKEQP